MVLKEWAEIVAVHVRMSTIITKEELEELVNALEKLNVKFETIRYNSELECLELEFKVDKRFVEKIVSVL